VLGMSSLLLLPFVLAGLDLGGRIGVALPSGGLGVQHASGVRLGAALGLSFGRSRVELDYDFAELAGRDAEPYRLRLHDLGGRYGFELLHRPSWGIEATAGASLSAASRSLRAARETGYAPVGHLGAGFIHRQGPTRFCLGLDHALFVENRSSGATTRLAFTSLLGLHIGVAYAR